MTDPDQQPGIVGQFLRGMRTSVSGNAQAFGFSITVTVTFGIVAVAEGEPTMPNCCRSPWGRSPLSPC